MKLYRTIYADPPWPEYGGGKIKRGADRHYSLMKVQEILDPPIQSFIDTNAHLYLWVTNNFLEESFKVVKAWGFRYVTNITWGKFNFRLGQYFRGQTEHCLFSVRGHLPYKIIDGRRQQGVTLILARKTQHSIKPEQMRRMIEKVSYPPYLELFARRKVPDWDAWGSEIENDIDLK